VPQVLLRPSRPQVGGLIVCRADKLPSADFENVAIQPSGHVTAGHDCRAVPDNMRKGKLIQAVLRLSRSISCCGLYRGAIKGLRILLHGHAAGMSLTGTFVRGPPHNSLPSQMSFCSNMRFT